MAGKPVPAAAKSTDLRCLAPSWSTRPLLSVEGAEDDIRHMQDSIRSGQPIDSWSWTEEREAAACPPALLSDARVICTHTDGMGSILGEELAQDKDSRRPSALCSGSLKVTSKAAAELLACSLAFGVSPHEVPHGLRRQ